MPPNAQVGERAFVDNEHIIAAIARELSADGTVPEWIELIPAGPEVKGRDGRKWLNDDPAAIVSAFKEDGMPLPIDWEHASFHRAQVGESAPAAGWIIDLELRDGAIWGKVDWTPRGAEMIRNREYRFISPEFAYNKKTGRIVALLTAGITNQPNLRLTALNIIQRNTMDPKIFELLGLTPQDGETAVITAINSLRARVTQAEAELATARASAPPLDKFVPRADYDVAVARATKAESDIATQKKEQLEKDIDAEIEAAAKAKKITPTTADYHREQCRQPGGLERFRAYVKAAPEIAADTDLGERRPPDTATALNSAELEVARQMGNTEEDLTKYGR